MYFPVVTMKRNWFLFEIGSILLGFPGLKPTGGSKVDTACHPSGVNLPILSLLLTSRGLRFKSKFEIGSILLGFPGLKPTGGSKADTAFHPSGVS